jgi:hypothetical protein
MGDRDPIYDALKAHFKSKFDADRQRFLEEAHGADDGGWTKHTQWHWSRQIKGERLDYWPSRKKFMWRGKVYRGLTKLNSIAGLSNV